MEREDLVEFATRERTVLARLKAHHWGDRRRAHGAAEGLRASDELRKHIRTLRPDWPSQEERDDDLATHVRVGAQLRRAGTLEPN